jgi:hypothetical protein
MSYLAFDSVFRKAKPWTVFYASSQGMSICSSAPKHQHRRFGLASSNEKGGQLVRLFSATEV